MMGLASKSDMDLSAAAKPAASATVEDDYTAYLSGFLDGHRRRRFQPSAAEVVAQSSGTAQQLHSYLHDFAGRPLSYYLVNLEHDGGRLVELVQPSDATFPEATDLDPAAAARVDGFLAGDVPADVLHAPPTASHSAGRAADAYRDSVRELRHLWHPSDSSAAPPAAAANLRWCDVLLHGRGAVGETALHLCFLRNTPAHRALARHLIARFGQCLCRQRFDPAIHPLMRVDVPRSRRSLPASPADEAEKRPSNRISSIELDSTVDRVSTTLGVAGGGWKEEEEDVNSPAQDVEAVFVKFVDATYTGASYCGEACLHIAIVNGDLASVQCLCESGADAFHPLTTGSFFRGRLYYGGRCLLFAAAHGQQEIFDYLVENENHKNNFLRQVDHFGNGVLHLITLHGQVALLKHVMGKYKEQLDLFQLNFSGFAPISLAAAIQSTEVFELLMDLSGEVLWAYGPVRCIRYPLLKLDSLLTKQLREEGAAVSGGGARGVGGNGVGEKRRLPWMQKTDTWASPKKAGPEDVAGAPSAQGQAGQVTTATAPHNSAQHRQSVQSVLEIIVEGRCHALFTPFVRQLIQDKWASYGRRLYFLQMLCYFLNLLLLVLATENVLAIDAPVAGVLVLIVLELGKLHFWWQRRIRSPLRSGVHLFRAVADAVTVEACFLALYCGLVLFVYAEVLTGEGGARRSEDSSSSGDAVSESDYDPRWRYDYAQPVSAYNLHSWSPRVLLGVASVFGWLHFLHNLRALEGLGPFVVMIKLMIKRDVARFAAIYVGVSFGFAHLLRVLFQDTLRRDRLAVENSSTSTGGAQTVWQTVQFVFRASLVSMDEEVFGDSSYQVTTSLRSGSK
mmetsp:Transcript_19620/g.49281  ORF Transcript_19620/g.49281 Transcript_19620/m.49281 type:complete len:847 (-) Transcript_19620:774-3314(-)